MAHKRFLWFPPVINSGIVVEVAGSEVAVKLVTVDDELLLDVPTDDGPQPLSSSEVHKDCVLTCTSNAVPI